MVYVGVSECETINGKNQFVYFIFVHLLLIGLNGTNGKYCFKYLIMLSVNYFFVV